VAPGVVPASFGFVRPLLVRERASGIGPDGASIGVVVGASTDGADGASNGASSLATGAASLGTITALLGVVVGVALSRLANNFQPSPATTRAAIAATIQARRAAVAGFASSITS
jgi:hypothetical protein